MKTNLEKNVLEAIRRNINGVGATFQGLQHQLLCRSGQPVVDLALAIKSLLEANLIVIRNFADGTTYEINH